MAGKIVAFIMVIAIIYMLYDLLRRETSGTESKEEYSKENTDKIESEEKKNFTAEEVEKIKKDSENQKNVLYGHIGRLEMEIKWFEEVCEKHIGSDWKEKTGYNDRK